MDVPRARVLDADLEEPRSREERRPLRPPHGTTTSDGTVFTTAVNVIATVGTVSLLVALRAFRWP